MRWLPLSAITLCVGALLACTGAAQATRRQAADMLQLASTFPLTGTAISCPAGTAATTTCVNVTGQATIRGLGIASETYTGLLDQANPSCGHAKWSPVVVTIAGKGQLDASFTDPYTCDPTSGAAVADFTITGGTGQYQGATGTGTGLQPLRRLSGFKRGPRPRRRARALNMRLPANPRRLRAGARDKFRSLEQPVQRAAGRTSPCSYA
jgi:hypothetical protein